ncbi:hypothetical protein Snov_1010 [Ancylobacter novellus DSM 506]|uniref:Uncharacterized protein n=1 Tax=Ancylobacter novellus (strain ATCC 8093 / DSM 506 / JCM 20403 / CCM 1077 / IAM 12100 / NBRC 12443 / NCIMB 10456) TaxID=639283 RepID=D7A6V8_ANCN5|nr:hypothetical protein [Ancylobacter novellus]ADH88332.1 hypothetical protein Snov_1010 [Ancylobacter novellus DSM 506]
MSTFVKLATLGVAAAAIGIALAGMDDRPGFGRVREAEPATKPAAQLDVSRQLVGLHDAMRILPEQEGAWRSFVAAIMELDRLTRAFTAEESIDSASADEERARHALMFGIALSEIEAALSAEQAALLQSRATSLGRAFVCSGVQAGTS